MSLPGGRWWWQRGVLAALGGLLLLFLALPVVALVVGSTPAELWVALGHPLVWPALRLSLWTTSIALSLAVLLGTPLAWLLARSESSAARVVESVLQLPIVLPPAVAGVALLLAFGREGAFSGWLYPQALSLPYSTAAVVLAQLFVASPFYLQAASGAFRAIDPSLLTVAQTFGASPWRIFWRLGIPLAAPGLFTGAAVCWARALGEFGATLMFAGNLQGVTQTLPLAVYAALEADLRVAQALSVLLVVIAFTLLLAMHSVQQKALRWRADDGGPPR